MSRDSLQVAASIAPLFYEGILNADQWYAALDALRRELGAVSFHQVTVDPSGLSVLDSVACLVIPDGKAEEYEQQHVGNDERVALWSRMAEGEVAFDHHHFDDRHISHSAIYDFLHGLDMRHTMGMGMVMRRGTSSNDYLAVLRAGDNRPYDQHDDDVMRLLAPEITRAARLRANAQELARQAAIGAAAMEQLPWGVVIVDAQRRIQYLNARATAYVRESSWCSGGHRFGLPLPAAQLQLEQAVAQACAAGHRAGVIRLGSGAATIVLRILPMPVEQAAAYTFNRPLALIAITMPYAGLSLSAGELSAALGVTPTEAELARTLAAGGTVKNFAMARGCTLNTARSHLKSLLAKTGCRRQVDLVQLIQAVGQG